MNRFTPWRGSGDLVPVADRLRGLAIWRAVVLVLGLVVLVAVPGAAQVERWPVIAGVGVFLAASTGLTALALRRNSRIIVLMRVLLLGDSLAIVALSLAVGGTGSPLRYLIILQAVEVTLLASFRTGLRVVVWQSLVVSGLYVVGPMLRPGLVTVELTVDMRNELAGLLACSWIAAITTAALAAANERELRRRRHDLEQLAEFHTIISETPEMGQVTSEFARRAADEFEAASVLVALPDEGDRLQVWATHGIDPAPAALTLIPGSIVAEAAASTLTLLVRDLDPVADAELVGFLGTDRRLAALPIRTPRGRGVVFVEPCRVKQDRVEKRVVSMLERYRDEMESTVSNLQLIESLRTAATTDALTGVANRGRLREALHAAVQQSIRLHHPLCVAILDVDFFKKVNDVHGHAAGDEVLKQVASILKHGVRPYDLVARYGGEEFVLLFPGLDLHDATATCERLRLAVAGGTSPVPVTISMGVARFDPASDDEDHVIARADELLYAAKQGGRNRVMVAEQRPFAAPVPGAPLPPPVLPSA